MIHFRNCKYDHDDTYGLVAQTFAHAFLTLMVHVSLVVFLSEPCLALFVCFIYKLLHIIPLSLYQETPDFDVIYLS